MAEFGVGEFSHFHVIVTVAHDRRLFEDPAFFADVLERFEALPEDRCFVVCYAFMSAHLHMLVTCPGEAALSHAMMVLLGTVGHRANARVQELGGVFVNPFWRKPVRSDAYRDHLPLYIHANPSPRTAPRMDFGVHTSHWAWMHGAERSWLRFGEALASLGGPAAYEASLAEYLRRRAERPEAGPEFGPELEGLVSAVSRATGTRRATLTDARRGGKEDRKLLAWGLAVCGSQPWTEVAAIVGAPEPTLRRWSRAVEADPAFAELRAAITAAVGPKNG